MVIEQLGQFQTQQFKNTSKTDDPQQNWVLSAQLNKLFASHDHILTRILQNGPRIPDHLVDQIKRKALGLRRIYFGLDNHLIEPSLLPQEQGQFLIMTTSTLPIIIPKVFLKEGITSESLALEKIPVNLIEEKNWWEIDADKMIGSDLLKTALVLFSPRTHVRYEGIKSVSLAHTPYIPQHAVIFSLKCNLFTFLLFFLQHQQFFSSLSSGLSAYLSFVKSAR